MYKIVKILAILIGVLGLILWVLLLGSESPYADIMINIAKFLVIITAAVVLIFTIKNLISHPDKLKKALIAIVGFVVIVGIGYVLADGTAQGTASASDSKWVGTGLWTFYILTIVAVAAMVISGVKKILSK